MEAEMVRSGTDTVSDLRGGDDYLAPGFTYVSIHIWVPPAFALA